MDCGALTANGDRCEACAERFKALRSVPTEAARWRHRDARRDSYNRAEWKRLSRKARDLQPFCSECGSTHDLQADHSPVAWERVALGLPVRLQDVDVLCGRCNRERGPARGPRRRKLLPEERAEIERLRARHSSGRAVRTQGSSPE